MKRSFGLLLLMTAVAAALVSTGCVRKAKSPTPIPPVGVRRLDADANQFPVDRVPSVGDNNSGVTGQTVGGGPSGTGPVTGGPEGTIPETTAGGLLNAKEDREFFSANTVYFDFDRSTIRAGERKKIEAVADYLKTKPAEGVKVEGHCDERGTEGYNIALGQRRAQAIREYLVKLGISAEQVITISYGEDRPAVDAHNDSAYAKNRRGEFVLLKP